MSAVITALKAECPNARIRFWTDFKFYSSACQKIRSENKRLRISRICAGKFRRYSGFTFIDYLQNPTTIPKNIADGFLVVFGFFQCLFKLIIWRPNVIFLKGGYVCLPIGLAARALRIPYVLHDSDAAPGLTNRILSKRAVKIATGMPVDNYNYPPDKAVYVGIPIAAAYCPVSKKRQKKLKTSFGFDKDKPLVVATGGGLGAQRINSAIVASLKELLPLTSIALISGKDGYDETSHALRETDIDRDSFKLYDFLASGMSDLLSAADIVVTRAGATSMAELASLSRAVILVPNSRLPGHHQVKNAQAMEKANAVLVVDDDQLESHPELIQNAVKEILNDSMLKLRLEANISQFSRPNAASDVARIILSAVKR